LTGLSLLAEIGGSPPDKALHWAARSGVTIAGLSNFTAVVHAGSIRRASRSLHLAQPYLSRQISRLEAVLGCSLLQRVNTGCEPTAQGERLNEIASDLVAHMAALTAPAERRFARTQRTVKLGTIIPIGHESRLASRLAALVACWRRDWPTQELLVSSTTAEDLIAGLRSGRYDVALTDMALHDRRFQSLEMFSSELVLVGRREALAQQGSLITLLQAHQIVVPSLRSGLRQRIREVLDPLLQEVEESAGLLVEVDALSIIVNLIVEHGFVSVLPLDAVRSLERDVGTVSLPGAPRIGFHLTWPRTVSAKALAKRIETFLAIRTDSIGPDS
jgi:LysR family nitrogen assimilation transcriptional regulator